MNKDRIEGTAKQAAGTVKQAAGKAVGSDKLAKAGQDERIEGKVQNAVGGIKDAVKK